MSTVWLFCTGSTYWRDWWSARDDIFQ